MFYIEGQPDIWRVFDMINRVENAAFLNRPSFLDYEHLDKQNLTTIVKACILDISSDFYETITPKAPLDVEMKLGHIGNTTFTTVLSLMCGGKMKPSVRIKNMHTLINFHHNKVEELPEWWKNMFLTDALKDKQYLINVAPKQLDGKAFTHHFCVPLSDTDIFQKTRCSSYLRYFVENASIASSREEFKVLKNNFHEFHVKKMKMLYFEPTCWGDELVSQCWEGEDLKLHCQVLKEGRPVWYSEMQLFSEVYGFT